MPHIVEPNIDVGRRSRPCRTAAFVWLAWLVCGLPFAHAEDGYDLWLRYHPLPLPWIEAYRPRMRELVPPRGADDAAQAELLRAAVGLLGRRPALAAHVTQDGAIVFGTPRSALVIASLGLDLSDLGSEGYLLQMRRLGGHQVLVIAANTDAGVLHGVFQLLRLMQTLQPIDRLALRSAPKLQYRILDHWDNLDGTVERGYAGASIWDW